MQTFLPDKDFKKSASFLDNKRLGKQRVETMQILKALTLPEYGWKNHPAVKMWKGYEIALVLYGLDICREWKSRGFKDTCEEKILDIADDNQLTGKVIYPHWLGDERVHSSHRSNLLRKDKDFYSKFNWEESDDIEYYWANDETSK
jgi:hypothetical protein